MENINLKIFYSKYLAYVYRPLCSIKQLKRLLLKKILVVPCTFWEKKERDPAVTKRGSLPVQSITNVLFFNHIMFLVIWWSLQQNRAFTWRERKIHVDFFRTYIVSVPN